MTYLPYFFCFALIHLSFGQLTNLGQSTLNTQGLSNLLLNARTPNNIPSQPYRALGASQTNTLTRNLATAGYGQGIPGNGQGVAGNGFRIAGNEQRIAGNGQSTVGDRQGIAGNRQGIADNRQAIAGNGLGNFAYSNTIPGLTSTRSISPYTANTPSILANTNSITGKDNTDQLRANLANTGIANQVPSNIGNTNFRNAKVIKYELRIPQDDSNIASNIGKISGNINGRLANSGRQYGLKVDSDGLKMVGDVIVGGKLPIYGTVGLNGKLPTKGAGNVEFSC